MVKARLGLIGLAVVVLLAVGSVGNAAASTSTQTWTDTTLGETAYTIPANTTSLQVTVVGASGSTVPRGDEGPGPAGSGARVEATLTRPFPGKTLYVEVGVGGGTSLYSAVGGGASAIQDCSRSSGGCTYTANPISDPRLVVAGGGGAGGEDSFFGGTGGAGGDAGRTITTTGPGQGGSGTDSGDGGAGANAGMSTSQTAAAAGPGSTSCTSSGNGGAGSPGNGGSGGTANGGNDSDGGGGGGGWVGGSGGGAGDCNAGGSGGGGGAGSSFVTNSATNVSVSEAGSMSAQVVITAIITVPDYAVTYDGNGSTGGSVPVDGGSPYTAGSTVTVRSPGSLTDAGYAFAGWNTAANGSGTSYSPGDTFTMPASAVTLYAIWQPTYAVTYDGNGNTGGSVPVDGGSPYTAGATVTARSPGSLSETGYSFAGWNTSADGSGTSYSPGDTFAMPAAPVTLYAVWQRSVAADGSGTMVVSPSGVSAGSTGRTLAFTYTAAGGGMIGGTVQLVVPGGWTAPQDSSSSGAGYVTSSAGTLSTSAQTITVSDLTMSSGQSLTVTYTNAKAATTTGVEPWTAQERSLAAGTLTALASAPLVTVYAKDGSGTIARTPTRVGRGKSGVKAKFAFTVAPGGINDGAVTLVVPKGWSAPQHTKSSRAGYVAASAGTVTVASRTVTVGGLTMSGGKTVTITIAHAKTPATAGVQTWAIKERSTLTGILTAVAVQPTIKVS